MALDFDYDVLLTHSSQDDDVVRDFANQLDSDSVRVWFDDWVLSAANALAAAIV